MDEDDAPVAPAKTREQVVVQLKAVAHLAKQIAAVHDGKAAAYAETAMEEGFIDFVGYESAALMETLGNILNNMDAVDETEDAWMEPIFKVAHATWPRAGLD